MNIMLKKYIIYPFVVIALLVASSCDEEFLELQPSGASDLNSAIQNIDGYRSAMNGVYSGLQSSNYYGRYFILVPDVMADDVKQNAQANRAREYSDYVGFSEHFIASGIFNTLYNVINRANTVINAETEVPAAVQGQKDQFRGEALAVRGLAHFDLVRIYGQHYGFTNDNSHLGVPIVTEFDQDAKPARSTVAQVYAQVISDLEQGVSLMNEVQSSAGRMSKEAAQALLARVHLYMGDWAKAEQLASSVINSGKYSLVATDQYVSGWSSQSTSESILSVFFRNDDDNGSDALGRMYIVEGYGDYLPSQDVIGLIPEGDVRLGVFKEDENLSGALGSVRMDKFPDPATQNSTPIVRLSEMYLIRAEARAMQNNDTGAQEDVTLIRQRGLPTADAVTATGEALLDEIATERRIELMFEGHRLWDLMRKKQGVSRTDCTNLICEIPYPNDRFILPIPQREIDANENMVQNSSY